MAIRKSSDQWADRPVRASLQDNELHQPMNVLISTSTTAVTKVASVRKASVPDYRVRLLSAAAIVRVLQVATSLASKVAISLVSREAIVLVTIKMELISRATTSRVALMKAVTNLASRAAISLASRAVTSLANREAISLANRVVISPVRAAIRVVSRAVTVNKVAAAIKVVSKEAIRAVNKVVIRIVNVKVDSVPVQLATIPMQNIA